MSAHHEPDLLETDFEAAIEAIADAITERLLAIKAIVGEHTFDPPWECQICGKTSAWLSGIMLHASRHLEYDETTPYPADDFRRQIPKLIAESRARREQESQA